MQHYLVLQHVMNDFIVLGDKQLQDVISSYLKVGVVRNGNFQLCILGLLGDDPVVVHEVTSLF